MSAVGDARLLTEALCLRAAVPALLWARPLDAVLQALTPAASPARVERATLPAIERLTDALTRGVPPLRTACLQRALLRYALMRRSGHAARFVIGVRPGGRDGFEAHAWVELDGAPIMEHEPADYRTTFRWPAEAS